MPLTRFVSGSRPIGTTCPGREPSGRLPASGSRPMGTTCPGREPSLGPGGPRSSQTQAHGHYVPGAGTVTRPWRASLLPNPSPWALRARGGNRHSALAGLAPPKSKPMGTSCPGRDLNPHVFRPSGLSRVRLPVPPPGRTAKVSPGTPCAGGPRPPTSPGPERPCRPDDPPHAGWRGPRTRRC